MRVRGNKGTSKAEGGLDKTRHLGSRRAKFGHVSSPADELSSSTQ